MAPLVIYSANDCRTTTEVGRGRVRSPTGRGILLGQVLNRSGGDMAGAATHGGIRLS